MSRRLALAFVLFALASCSTMQITNRWKDPSWSGSPAGSVLVIGVARSDTLVRLFEDTFSQQLVSAGLKSTPGYTQIRTGERSIELGELARRTGSDAVLVTRVQRVEQRINVSPGGPGYGGFAGWYGGAWAATPEVTSTEVVTLETSVWDPRSDKLVWTATTQGVATNDIPKATSHLAQTLIPALKSDGVIR